MVKKNFGQKKFWIKKIESKIFWVIKILGQKIFWVKKFWDEKNVVQKDLNPKLFLSKKTGRVNPRWRIYDPPPENSRVKLCWVVVSIDG